MVALVALGVGGHRLLDSSPQPAATAVTAGAGASASSAGGSTAGAPSAVRAVQAVLDARAAALLGRDRTAWLAPVAGEGSVTEPARSALAAYAARTARTFDRLGAVPLAIWTWEVTGSGTALSAERAQQLPAGSWVARTTLVWSLEGAGDDPVRRQQDLTVVPSGDGGWAVADDADGDTVPDLWDLGDVSVLRGDRAVVLGTAGADELRRAAAVATTAAQGVDAVWGTGWPRRTVIEVPADQDQMARLLGRDDDTGLDQIAAVTTGELTGADGATRGDHVVVNPKGFGQLAPLGQRVVLTHELTHVATRHDAVRAVPLWFSEGFADWVGYRGTGLARAQVADDLLRTVRADGPPADLPAADAFDPSKTDVGPAYSGAWLAVDSLARRYGDDAVVQLYRAASQAPPAQGATGSASDDDAAGDAASADAALDAALDSVMHTDRAAVVTGWQDELEELAGT